MDIICKLCLLLWHIPIFKNHSYFPVYAHLPLETNCDLLGILYCNLFVHLRIYYIYFYMYDAVFLKLNFNLVKTFENCLHNHQEAPHPEMLDVG